MRDRFRDNWDGANHVSLGFLDVLTLIFITLKLTAPIKECFKKNFFIVI